MAFSAAQTVSASLVAALACLMPVPTTTVLAAGAAGVPEFWANAMHQEADTHNTTEHRNLFLPPPRMQHSLTSYRYPPLTLCY
jgi:hypothetical protein